jgi:cyclohexanecarboxylate-CoA ligase
MAAGRGMAAGQGFVPADRYGVAFPFTHIGGLTNLCAVLSAGFALILLEVFDPTKAVEVFRRHGATVVGGGPAFYRAYLEQQRLQPRRPILPELRFMTGGGAPMPPSMHFEVRTEIGGRGCAHGYGMTETCSILSMNHPDDDDEHLCHTSGRVVPGMEVRVITSSGQVAPPGVEGEIRVRGEFLLAGYVDSSLDDPFDEDGWFRSGDLGSIDADRYMRVTGRIKDIIIRKGENISAKEIEDLLYAHPSIADVAVIGLPDDERGELVCAVVVPAPGAQPLDIAGITAYLDTRQLMRQKYPERIEVVDALPRNASGKVMKQSLLRAYRGDSREARS